MELVYLIKFLIQLIPNKKLIFECNSGNRRCDLAYNVAKDSGIEPENVYKLDDVTKEWIGQGYPNKPK